MTTFSQEIEKKEAAAQAAQQEQTNRAEWSRICDTWDVTDCDGNFYLVREFCEGQISLEKFRMLLEVDAPGFDLEWKGTRDKIIQDILDLLHDPTGKRMSAFDLKNAEKSMKFWPKARLRARLAELQYKAQLQPKTATEIKADLEAHRKAEQAINPFPGWPRLPKSIVRPGTVTAVPLDAAFIRTLSPYELRRMNAVYSVEQVNSRLRSDA